MRAINHIVIHCTATREHQDFKAADIDRWHKDRGWSGIGYHYVVRLDGTVEKGRPDAKNGAGVRGHNHDSIHVVYVGGLDKSGKAKDTRTKRQKYELLLLVIKLKKKYPCADVSGHRDFSIDRNKNGIIESNERMKECPCYDAKIEYQNV
ncbi:MAG: N-acetylmuramoyl-L-alanine amidase [Psychroserpens sp.]|uniref:N-acetylmuramoyl-L-alanine amidase n=1 Tax=Psychroserpens sp. TaxID=2020870 RepID=UPI003C9EDC6D